MVKNLLKNMFLESKQRNIPIFTINTQNFIGDILAKHKPKFCLEIGSAIGYSSIFMGNQINKWGGNLMSFEISYPTYKEALSNIEKSNLHNIKLYNFDFTKIPLKSLIFENLDFVFIDGSKKQYIQYFKMIYKYLKKGCVVIFDDAIKFKNKINPLYAFLEKNQLFYKIIQLDNDDGIIYLQIN